MIYYTQKVIYIFLNSIDIFLWKHEWYLILWWKRGTKLLKKDIFFLFVILWPLVPTILVSHLYSTHPSYSSYRDLIHLFLTHTSYFRVIFFPLFFILYSVLYHCFRITSFVNMIEPFQFILPHCVNIIKNKKKSIISKIYK